MSLHHQMMLQRYGLGRPFDMYNQVNCDPVFFPLFTTFFSSTLGFSAAAAGTLGGIASALSAGGDYWECSI